MIEAMHSSRALTLALALLTLNCSGEQFASADPQGSGGGNGAGGTGKITPGATAGASAVPGDPGGSSGGTTQMVDPDDVIVQPGGGPGVIGGGAAGSASVPIEEPVTLDLTECGPNAFGTGIVPTLYSTLDDESAIIEPMIGELGFVGNAEADYHGDHCGPSINIDQNGDYVKYHYQDNGVQHFSPMVGAMDFWYLPSYSHTDGLNHHLFSTANWASLGGFRMRKAAANNANSFQVIVASSALEIMEISVAADQYQLAPDQWARITLIWYLSPDMPQRYVRLFIDGTLVGQVEPESDFFMEWDEGGYFVLGAWHLGDPEHAAGFLDDFKVFGRGP